MLRAIGGRRHPLTTLPSPAISTFSLLSMFIESIIRTYFIVILMINLTSKQSLKVVKALIQTPYTSQLSISHSTNVSLGQVNHVISALKDANIISRPEKNRIQLVDYTRLLEIVGWQRPMKKLLLGKFKGNKISERKIAVIPKIKYSFTLLSALQKYSAYASSDKVQFYISAEDYPKARKHLQNNGFTEDSGGKIEIYMFDSPDILKESQRISNLLFVSRVQLLIDLFGCGREYSQIAYKFLEDFKRG
jgi:hypothetical protein